MSKEFSVPSLPLWLFAPRLEEVVGFETETGLGESEDLQRQAKEAIVGKTSACTDDCWQFRAAPLGAAPSG